MYLNSPKKHKKHHRKKNRKLPENYYEQKIDLYKDTQKLQSGFMQFAEAIEFHGNHKSAKLINKDRIIDAYHRKQHKKIIKKKIAEEKQNRNKVTPSILKQKEVVIKPVRNEKVPYYVIKKWRRVFTKALAFQKLSGFYKDFYEKLKQQRPKIRSLVENKLEQAIFKLSQCFYQGRQDVKSSFNPKFPFENISNIINCPGKRFQDLWNFSFESFGVKTPDFDDLKTTFHKGKYSILAKKGGRLFKKHELKYGEEERGMNVLYKEQPAWTCFHVRFYLGG